jgi:hypothetical protein
VCLFELLRTTRDQDGLKASPEWSCEDRTVVLSWIPWTDRCMSTYLSRPLSSFLLSLSFLDGGVDD